MRGLGAFCWQGLVVVLLGGVGIEREVELVAPAEFEALRTENYPIIEGKAVIRKRRVKWP